MGDRLMNLREVAEELNLSLTYVRNSWPKILIQGGCYPIRLTPKSQIMVKRSEFNRMLERKRVVCK